MRKGRFTEEQIIAVDMLTKGASPYDVAKMLADTIETIEKHYSPFVRELRERVRTILQSEGGLEKTTVTPASQSAARIHQLIQSKEE